MYYLMNKDVIAESLCKKQQMESVLLEKHINITTIHKRFEEGICPD
ncbi:MAG: hypothetical protein K2G55_19810 [Lachnospiraceae bacterium]|nr:hypothetical protein [Lachnospiraceae bacterium]MDE7201315.1 hypothetical protein [Lachnospiraceae bacterium]